MKWIAMVFVLGSSFSWSSEKPPELWSWIKDLNKSKEACEIQSTYVLQSLSLENQVENQYGIYGNLKSNRVVVKCIAISHSASKLLVSVAGNNRDSVEIIRNKIIKSIN
ncbi:hypothetical protein MIB92_13885 [Aestuariirhabdus sp. Z084]|uniref:hypothetical protein n=1 Tax=Aestuariirhabdus haliotis TaxID=2918751 RepID=UPI0020BD7171|nr:hypothetical protein [Aestuariirhabdus haliotis]MCL6416746.1 hypothetical protein [Aestuariirhabdus haliotis]